MSSSNDFGEGFTPPSEGTYARSHAGDDADDITVSVSADPGDTHGNHLASDDDLLDQPDPGESGAAPDAGEPSPQSPAGSAPTAPGATAPAEPPVGPQTPEPPAYTEAPAGPAATPSPQSTDPSPSPGGPSPSSGEPSAGAPGAPAAPDAGKPGGLKGAAAAAAGAGAAAGGGSQPSSGGAPAGQPAASGAPDAARPQDAPAAEPRKGAAPTTAASDPNASALENEMRERGTALAKQGLRATTGGASDVAMAVPGVEKVVDEKLGTAVGKAFKRAKYVGAFWLFVIGTVILALVAVVAGSAFQLTQGYGFPLPPDPNSMEIKGTQDPVWDDYTFDADDENIPHADDLMPPGWAEVVYRAQQESVTSSFGVPWTVLAGLARTQSDFGRRSPYDMLDRDITRPAMYGLPPNSTGSSGVTYSILTYSGPVLVLGTGASDIIPVIAGQVDNQIDSQQADGSTLSSLKSLSVKNSDYNVVLVYIDVPVGEDSETITKQVNAVLNELGKGRQVVWANGAHPGDRPAQALYNKVLAEAAAARDNLTILKWVDIVDNAEAKLVNDSGQLTGPGRARLGREFATAVKNASTAGGWVIPLPKGSYTITATFGQPGAMWASGAHTGLDMAAPTGTPVYAASDGFVSFAGDDGSYGNKVELSHSQGVSTWYAHMASIKVAQGTQVTAGQQIGTVGETGNVTGPHLHLEALTGGAAQNPLTFIPQIAPNIAPANAQAAARGLHDEGGVNALAVADPTNNPGYPKVLPAAYTPASGGGDSATVSSGLTQADASGASVLLADGDKCEVDIVEPAIGGEEGRAAGAFLLRPAAVAAMKEEGLNPQDPCAQATWVAEALVGVGAEVLRTGEFSDWENDDEVAAALWAAVITEADIFADPTNGDVDCTVTEAVTAQNAAQLLHETVSCFASLQEVLEVATAVTDFDGSKAGFAVVEGSAAGEQLATEAVMVAAVGPDRLDPGACKPNAKYAGVFPLTRREASSVGVADRCDAAAVITAVARSVVEANAVPVDQRPKAGGRFSPMLTGWARFSAAAGRGDVFAQQGPRQDWTVPEECVAAVSQTLKEAVASNGSVLAELDMSSPTAAVMEQIRGLVRLDPVLRSGKCAGGDTAEVYSRVAVIAQGLAEVSASAPSQGLFGDETAEDEPAPEVEFDLAAARGFIVVGAWADRVATAVTEADPAFALGLDAGVERLRIRAVRSPRDAAVVSVDTVGQAEFPLAATAVGYAVGYGGVRPEWETADVAVLGAANLASAMPGMGGYVAGADAATVIAAARTQLGVDYSWGGGGPAGPSFGIEHGANIRGFDCSGLMEFAFSKAGYQIGGTSNAQKTAGVAVTGGLKNAIPGDLLFWGAPTTYHVALYLGNGQMIEAPRTGDVVKVAPVRSGVTYIRRVIKEDLVSTAGASGGPDAAALSAKLPEGGKQFAADFVEAGRKYNIDPALLASMAFQESSFSPDVYECRRASSAGARGLMQFMPATATERGVDPCVPAQAIDGAAGYMRENLNRFGQDLTKALAAYNMGPGAVAEGRALPVETQNYVREIPARCRDYGGCKR